MAYSALASTSGAQQSSHNIPIGSDSEVSKQHLLWLARRYCDSDLLISKWLQEGFQPSRDFAKRCCSVYCDEFRDYCQLVHAFLSNSDIDSMKCHQNLRDALLEMERKDLHAMMGSKSHADELCFRKVHGAVDCTDDTVLSNIADRLKLSIVDVIKLSILLSSNLDELNKNERLTTKAAQETHEVSSEMELTPQQLLKYLVNNHKEKVLMSPDDFFTLIGWVLPNDRSRILSELLDDVDVLNSPPVSVSTSQADENIPGPVFSIISTLSQCFLEFEFFARSADVGFMMEMLGSYDDMKSIQSLVEAYADNQGIEFKKDILNRYNYAKLISFDVFVAMSRVWTNTEGADENARIQHFQSTIEEAIKWGWGGGRCHDASVQKRLIAVFKRLMGAEEATGVSADHADSVAGAASQSDENCPVCLERYDDTGHAQIMLSECRHVIGLKCLNHMGELSGITEDIGMNHLKRCPICRNSINVEDFKAVAEVYAAMNEES